MSEHPDAAEWAATRGEKWLAQLAGMEATLAPVDEPLIRALDLHQAFRIADIGCGGGGTTLEIARRAPAGSVVHGFDISPALIEAARARRSPQQRAVEFEVADVAKRSAPGEGYDRLTSRFGIMFFDDPLAAFSGLRSWLAPTGRFAFAAWGPPAENPWFMRVRDVVASLVALPAPDANAPGPFRYADAGTLLAILGRAGFVGVEVRDWRGPLRIGGGLPAAEAANFALASISSFSELLAGAGETVLRDAGRLLAARFAGYEENGAVSAPACVHIFTGGRN